MGTAHDPTPRNVKMQYDYHEIGELERKGVTSFAGPYGLLGPGKPVRTYQQSQFVNCLHSAIEALESSNRSERARVAKELRAFLEKQGIST